MLDFKIIQNPSNKKFKIQTSLTGKALLTIPQLNKGTAFSQEERQAFGLMGKLPHRVETLEEQVKRAYLQYASYTSKLQQNIYLNNLHDKNQILFYKLLSTHLAEMLPTIYTPIVGTAVKRFSHEYRQPRGLYIAYTDRPCLEEIIKNRSNPEIDLIVVTDGESVLGIGDQGIGGMDIPVAKLMVYSLCGGINPARTLPIFLDVGTNNQELLADPFYLGCRHPRISLQDYNAFIDDFVQVIKKHFPRALLHWEDFGKNNARRLLNKYQDQICTFNDDIQGTGAVTLAALLAASEVSGQPLEDQTIIVFGAGTAGTGIADQIVGSLIRLGLQLDTAYERIWLVDRQGLLFVDDPSLTEAQIPFAKSRAGFHKETYSLVETIKAIKATVLIGCSAQFGAFNQAVVAAMADNCPRPVIFPLSNPDEKCEAHPSDILTWSKGSALIATGTAFPSTMVGDKAQAIAQCNNALIFPGIGLGVLAVRASRITEEMIWAAAETLVKQSPAKENPYLPLLPPLENAQSVAKNIAIAVAEVAIKQNLAQCAKDLNLEQLVNEIFWEPNYLPFEKV